MPFLVADEKSVTVDAPFVECNGDFFQSGEPVTSWDYLQQLTVTAGFAVDEHVFREQTGLTGEDDLSGVVAVVQVDCPTTNWRAMTKTPVALALGGKVPISVDVPPGLAAQQLVVTCSVLLDAPDGPPRTNRAAHLRGSRLFTAPESWRFPLEGTAAGFPTDALPFSSAGLDPTAPWHLAVTTAELNAPFMKAVRLQINTDHPASQTLLAGKDKVLNSLLFHDILLQMLLSVAETVREDQEGGWEEDSLGQVLDGLCDTYLRTSLPSACESLTSDPAELMTALKGGTGLLKDFSA